MDPVTHALTSAALGRVGLNKRSRMAVPVLVVAGTVADVDWLARLGGAEAFLRWYRTVTHSLPGTAAIVLLVAAAFWLAGRKSTKYAISFSVALTLALLAAGLHLVLDLADNYGVKPLWPFRSSWYALGWVPEMDFAILFIFAACFFVPELLRLVSEEVRSKSEQSRGRGGAILALALLALLIAARAVAQHRALETLQSRQYRGEAPVAAGAFASANPLLWSGVVDTDDAVLNANVSLMPGQTFDPERAAFHFKPSPSSALTAAQATPVAKEFLAFAKFPLASVEPAQGGFEVRLRDVRFASRPLGQQGIVAIVLVDSSGSVVEQRLEYTQPPPPGQH